MKSTHVISFVVILLLVAIWAWPDGYKIKNVVDGNTIQLNNDAVVCLIGVTNAEQGMDHLQSLIGQEVVLQPDNAAYFDPARVAAGMKVYAYVMVKNHEYECINASLLKLGKAGLQCDTYLTDSVKPFKFYAGMGSGNAVEPVTPVQPHPIHYPDDDIILPQYVSKGERKHSAWYTDGNLNTQMLEEACDYNLPYTKSFANQLAARSPGNFNMGQVCEIFDYCYKKWRYVNDPGDQEYLASASESIAGSLTGDCDDFAVLMASCILAVGGNAGIVIASTDKAGHAYAELDITEMDQDVILSTVQARFTQYAVDKIHIRKAGGKVWMNLDWQAAYPGAPYWLSTERAYYYRDNGKWNWVRN